MSPRISNESRWSPRASSAATSSAPSDMSPSNGGLYPVSPAQAPAQLAGATSARTAAWQLSNAPLVAIGADPARTMYGSSTRYRLENAVQSVKTCALRDSVPALGRVPPRALALTQ